MHPHVEFFDKLASRMDGVDAKVSRLLCGIRDQIDAYEKGNSSGRIKMGNSQSYNSVLRSVTFLIDKYGEEHPKLREVLASFVQKVNKTGSLL